MLRYQRNIGSITPEQQTKILNSKVLVIGLGGLGGQLIEGLARLGFQYIGICDYDYVDLTNLNRQVLSLPNNINVSKVKLAQQRINLIDDNIKVKAYENAYPHDEISNDLALYDLIFDALDNNGTRLVLENDIIALDKVLIHGAIAGDFGYFGITSKGNTLIKNQIHLNKGVEIILNNPYYTPALVANLQIKLALKYLFNKSYLKKGFYVLDLEDLSIDKVEIA